MQNNQYPFIIIGGGISGMTAAIYLKRAGHDVLILEKEIPGGQINRTAEIENYPGFLQIDGPSFAMNVYGQVQKLEIPMVFENVVDVKKILQVIREVHPYEEPGIDIIPLLDENDFK